MQKRVCLNFDVDPALLEQFKELCQKEGVTMAADVRAYMDHRVRASRYATAQKLRRQGKLHVRPRARRPVVLKISLDDATAKIPLVDLLRPHFTGSTVATAKEDSSEGVKHA